MCLAALTCLPLCLLWAQTNKMRRNSKSSVKWRLSKSIQGNKAFMMASLLNLALRFITFHHFLWNTTKILVFLMRMLRNSWVVSFKIEFFLSIHQFSGTLLNWFMILHSYSHVSSSLYPQPPSQWSLWYPQGLNCLIPYLWGIFIWLFQNLYHCNMIYRDKQRIPQLLNQEKHLQNQKWVVAVGKVRRANRPLNNHVLTPKGAHALFQKSLVKAANVQNVQTHLVNDWIFKRRRKPSRHSVNLMQRGVMLGN